MNQIACDFMDAVSGRVVAASLVAADWLHRHGAPDWLCAAVAFYLCVGSWCGAAMLALRAVRGSCRWARRGRC